MFNTSFQPRWFIVGDTFLAYFDSREQCNRFKVLNQPLQRQLFPEDAKSASLGTVSLIDCLMEKHGAWEDSGYLFSVSFLEGRCYKIVASNETNADKWISHISDAAGNRPFKVPASPFLLSESTLMFYAVLPVFIPMFVWLQ